MHPWERDARLVKKALKKGEEAYNLIVEVSCTRSAEDLLGARKAYHSLFDQSMEEDIASHVHGPHRKVNIILYTSVGLFQTSLVSLIVSVFCVVACGARECL